MQENSAVWRDVLFNTVPMIRLDDSFRRAIKNNRNSFAPNAFDLLNAFREIQTEEIKIKTEALGEVCPDEKAHLNKQREVVIYSLFTDTDELVPCKTCRIADYEKWRKNQASLYGEMQPLTKLQKLTENRIYANLKDPAEILNRAINEVTAKMVKVAGTAEYDDLRGFWLTLINARAYVSAND